MVRLSNTEWLIGDDRFLELMHALTHPEEPWTEPERPDILASLNELIAWSNDSRNYDERIHKSGWSSAIKDFLQAGDSLGSKTMGLVRDHIEAIRSVCHPDIGGDQPSRAKLSVHVLAIRGALADTATLIAAWTDLLRICSRKESSMNSVAARRDAFWAVVRATDRNPVELSRRLSSVLSGDAFNALQARFELNEIERIDGDLQSLRGAPPTSPPERLSIVLRLLSSEAASRAHVVSFAFRRAHLSSMSQQLNWIQFFEARWLVGNLFGDGPFKDQIPSELNDVLNENSIPDQRDVVLARIDLGIGTFSDAIRAAAERVDALLGMSTIGVRIPWQRMQGFIHAQDGRIVAQDPFAYNSEEFQSVYAYDRAGAQIGRMAPRVAPMIPVQDRNLKDIIDALHWWRAGLDQPTAASVVHNVRVIELIASRVGETSWTTYLEKYMKNAWIHGAVLDTLDRALSEALHRPVAPDAKVAQRNILLEATTWPDGQERFDIAKAVHHLDTIISFTPSNLPLGRDLRTIKQRTSRANAIRTWWAELESQWGNAVYRLERVRNSIAHGGPFTERAVLLTQPFSQRLSVWALWESIDGFLEGKTVAQSHIDAKGRWDDWRSSAQTATTIEGIFVNDER